MKKTNKRNKQAVSLLLAGSMAMSLLTGCGGASSGQKTTEAETAADGSIELSIWVHETDSSDEGKHYARLIEAFNEQYAGKYHANLS